MARPLIPFVQNGYYASRNWIPLVKGNGFTTSGGGEQEEVWETASGSVVTFDAIAAPLRKLSVAVEPVQNGTGGPSPTNVRPITGWNSVNIWVQPTHDTTAEPTATIQLGETVYGGTLDVLTGALTVDRAMVTLDGSEEWYADGGSRYRTRQLDALVKSGRTEVLSNIGIFSNIETGVGTIFLNPVNGVGNIYYYPPTSITTVNEFKAWLSTNNMQVVYPLATPFELTLTPEQIATLQGTNNVWSDAGDVTVEYRAQ